MGKTMILNMKDYDIKGDILDIAGEGNGIIYNISKEIDSEIAIDYVEEGNKEVLRERKYKSCTFFFNLNKIFTLKSKERLIRESINYLDKSGEIYIWDIGKERGRIIKNHVKVILPNDKVKDIEFKNLNPLASSSVEEIKKILEKYCEIEETKVWEDIFFIKGKKIAN